MTQEMRGSEKMKATCQTMASLTPEQIAQVAGGFSWSGSIAPYWLINGIPFDPHFIKFQPLQLNESQINQQLF